MTSARRALFYSYLSNYLSLGLNFAASIIIARLLTPSEVGVFSIAAAFVALGHIIRDFGVSQYVIQEQELTPTKIRAAFTVTLLIGWCIALLIWLLAPLAGTFYENPGISEVLALLTLNFVLLPFGSITSAYLHRQMRMDRILWIKGSAAVFQSITGVTCAYLGFSYMSLAWGALAGTVATIIVANLLRPKSLPVLPGIQGISQVLGFGSRLGATRVLGHIAEVTPELVMGKFFGMHAVGLWSRAQGTVTLFGSLIMNSSRSVITPTFAKAEREGRPLKPPYLHVLSAITGLAWSFYAGLAVLAPDLILFMFGDKWAGAIPYVQLWCLPVSIYHLMSFFSDVLVGTGHVNRMVRVDLTLSATRLVLTGLAATISAEAVLLAATAVAAMRLPLHRKNLREVLDVGLIDIARVSLGSIQLALAVGLMAWSTLYLLSEGSIESNGVRLFAGITAAGVALLGTAFLTRHPLAQELTRFTTHLMKRRSRTEQQPNE